MSVSEIFVRTIFFLLSILFATLAILSLYDGEWTGSRLIMGLAAGGFLGIVLMSLDVLIKRIHLRALTVSTLGLLLGYLFGYALVLVFNSLIYVVQIPIAPEVQTFTRLFLFLTATYLGTTMTLQASEELHLSIPFIRLKPAKEKKKDLVLDPSVLTDTRIIDLAGSGLLDHHVVLPRFLLKELYKSLESKDDDERNKARRSLEVIKRLEGLKSLHLRYAETDFPELNEVTSKLIRLARLLDANIIASDMNRIQQSTLESIEGLRIISIHTLANALKPLTQAGECLSIKIQRYGKESGQGVGYLEDGTMVVVNGGADFLGETVKAQVLSVKHTSSGRMIFSNVYEMDTDDQPHAVSPSDRIAALQTNQSS